MIRLTSGLLKKQQQFENLRRSPYNITSNYDHENDSASVLTPTNSEKNCTIANVAKYYSRIYVA